MVLVNRNTLLHVVLLLLIAALMGGLFPLIKIAEQAITPLALAMLRALLAAIVLLFIVGVAMRRDLTAIFCHRGQLFSHGRAYRMVAGSGFESDACRRLVGEPGAKASIGGSVLVLAFIRNTICTRLAVNRDLIDVLIQAHQLPVPALPQIRR